MTRLHTSIYLLLAILFAAQIFMLWNYTQLQKSQAQQLASMHEELLALKSITEQETPARMHQDHSAKSFTNTKTTDDSGDIKNEIRQLVAEELQPLLATQKDLINSLENAQSKQLPSKHIVTETFDLEEEINAFEESSSIITQSISNNRMDSQSATRLHELSQFLTEDSKRELRDRIVIAINNQQLALSSDFIPPF